MSRFFIVNEVDRPCERLIAEKRGEFLFYIHPDMQEDWHDCPMETKDATPLESFGVVAQADGKHFFGVLFPKRAAATYFNGEPRKWQGSAIFRFKYTPQPEAPSVPED